MPYEIHVEQGEQLQAKVALKLSRKAKPFNFGVTNRALYIPRVKLIAKTDPYYFQQVRLEQVQQVAVRKLAPYGLWILGGLMICAGAATMLLMAMPFLTHTPGEHLISGWPISLFVCGFLLPFVARGRFALEVVFTNGKYRWKPPLVVDRLSKEKITEAIRTITEACQRVGTRVLDERQHKG